MRAIRGLAAFAVAASLSACAQSTSMPDIGLFGGGPEPAATPAPAPATPAKQTVAEKPAANAPAASRNAKKAAPAKGNTAVTAAKAPAAAPTTAAAKEPESSGSGFSFGSLSQMTLFTGSTTPEDSVETHSAPVATYSMLAQRIHACWFTPGKPQLTNHGFHAEVAPNGSGDAKIIIYEKGPDNKRGIQVFRITISGSGSSNSVVSSENRRLDAKLDAAFKADLARWAKGDDRCKG